MESEINDNNTGTFVETRNELKHPKQSIRLSLLNSDVRKKVAKFDTANDGELDISEAIQGLITLQKQSNNYKKILLWAIPSFLITIACVFAVTLLAIKLTKEVQVTSGSSVLRTLSGNPVSTGTSFRSSSLFDVAWNPISVGSLQYIQINGTLLSVDESSQVFNEELKCRASIRTSSITIILDQIDSKYSVEVNPTYGSDVMANEVKFIVSEWLNKSFISNLDRMNTMRLMRPVCKSYEKLCNNRCYNLSNYVQNLAYNRCIQKLQSSGDSLNEDDSVVGYSCEEEFTPLDQTTHGPIYF